MTPRSYSRTIFTPRISSRMASSSTVPAKPRPNMREVYQTTRRAPTRGRARPRGTLKLWDLGDTLDARHAEPRRHPPPRSVRGAVVVRAHRGARDRVDSAPLDVSGRRPARPADAPPARSDRVRPLLGPSRAQHRRGPAERVSPRADHAEREPAVLHLHRGPQRPGHAQALGHLAPAAARPGHHRQRPFPRRHADERLFADAEGALRRDRRPARCDARMNTPPPGRRLERSCTCGGCCQAFANPDREVDVAPGHAVAPWRSRPATWPGPNSCTGPSPSMSSRV